MKTRLAIVASHPIQHFAPLYRELAKQPELDVRVFFCSRMGLDAYVDAGFGVELRWETNLLEGYQSEFLDRATQIKSLQFKTVYSLDLHKRLGAFQPDVVQLYGYKYAVALQALAWSRLAGVPTLLMSDSELVHTRPLRVRAAKRLLIPALYRAVQGFLTIGDNNEAYLAHYGVARSRMFRSPYPTDDALFLRTAARLDEVRKETRERLNIEEDTFVVLFVGKLIDRKRPSDLLAAVRLARAQTGRSITALFAGDGILRAVLEAEAANASADVAIFAGFVNQADLPSMYAAADALVHPADHDPHPIAVNEAVLMGLPVIVSDKIGSIGPTDTVRPSENGLVFGAGDVRALASALGTLVGDLALRQRMSEAARRIAAETNMQASVRGYLNAVKTVTRSVQAAS